MKHGKMILGELHADIPVIQGGMGVGISLSMPMIESGSFAGGLGRLFFRGRALAGCLRRGIGGNRGHIQLVAHGVPSFVSSGLGKYRQNAKKLRK